MSFYFIAKIIIFRDQRNHEKDEILDSHSRIEEQENAGDLLPVPIAGWQEPFVKKGGTIWIISQEITTWHWLLLDTEGIRIFRLYLSSVRLYYTTGNIKIQREDFSLLPR